MQSSSKCKDRSYTSSWCIQGEKLNLLENPRKCYGNRQINFTCIPDICGKDIVNGQPFMKNKQSDRVFPQLNQRDYECNKQLKHIYETVEVDEFKRILNNFYISSVYRQFPRQNSDDILMTIDAEKIYEEFFGCYYQFLQDISYDS